MQLARLEWELRQRRELAGVCSELVASKERVAAAIAAARSRLDALAPHLKDVLKATKPLQECLALRLDEKRDELNAAGLLPPPLFLLYANAGAYSDALGAKVVTVGKSISLCPVYPKYYNFEIWLQMIFQFVYIVF